MKRGLFVAAAIAAVLSVHTGALAAHEEFKLIGKMVKNPEDMKPGEIVPEDEVLYPGPYETKKNEYWKIRVTRGTDVYYIMFGPDPLAVADGDDPIGKGEIRTCAADPTHHEFAILDGVGYFGGTRPYGGSEGGSAIGEGSIFIVQGIPDDPPGNPQDDYFVYLDEGVGTYMTVHNKNVLLQSQAITEINEYSTVEDDGTIIGPVPTKVATLSGLHDIRRRNWETLKCADAIGLPRPVPY